jgi:hypothetical protein
MLADLRTSKLGDVSSSTGWARNWQSATAANPSCIWRVTIECVAYGPLALEQSGQAGSNRTIRI